MSALLGRAAAATTRRPRTVIAIWLIVVAVLAAFGLGVGAKLSTRAVFVEGSAAKRAHEIAVRQFGDEEAFIVGLHGPPAAVEAQGKELTDRFRSASRAVVISPWSAAKTIPGLRPRPDVAALLINVKPRPGQGQIAVVAAVKHTVATTVSPPVRANVAGGAVVLDSFHDAAEDAAATGEKIAIPILLIVLLIVFRSVFAALIPVIVGGAVVASTRGVMDLSLGFIHLESFALGPAGMIGLALGVDYTLLVVSRYREELARRSGDVEAAVTETVISSGRAVIPAGCGLIAAMLVGTIVLPSPLLISAAFAVIAVALLSMVSAILVTPSVLVLLGKNLDRWSIGVRPERRGTFARWSEALSRRPIILVPIIVTLVGLSIFAFALRSEAATISFLPGDDPGRVQQEAIEGGIGAGWAAPLEIVMDGGDEPVTTPARLHALARFQRRVEADPDVVAMAGLAPIEQNTKQLNGIDEELEVPETELAKLKGGIVKAREGSETAEARIAEAAAGAGELGTATGEAASGSSQLGEGIEEAGSGSSELAGGIERTGAGSERLADGVTDAGAQSARLAAGVAKAHQQSGQASSGSHLLENALRSGNEALGSVKGPLKTSEEQLAVALATLQEMSAESGNPGYAKALGAVESASESMTGTSATTGEPLGTSEGAATGVEQGQNQFSLGMYLAHKIKKNGKQASRGLGKLQQGAEQLSQGIGRLSSASRELSQAIDRLQGGGEALPPSLQQLAAGAERLTAGLQEIDAGAAGLEGGLGGGAEGLRGLTGALGGVEGTVAEKQGEAEEAEEESQQLTELKERSPRLFRSGYFYLASLDGAKPGKRRQAAFLINLDHGGHAARMLVVPRSASVSSGTDALRANLGEEAERLARETDSEVVVGGVPGIQAALNTYYRDESPYLRIALLLVSVVVLVLVLRSLAMPLIAALLNLITVAASFGILALLSNGSLIGGPGHVDSTVVPATIMVMFGLSIDYEIFLFARMREEYDRTGSPDLAVTNGIDHTAHVITGAAIIMIAVFVAFSFSAFITIRDFGVAQVIAVFIDAFVIRLVVVPTVMRGLGERAWWVPHPFRRGVKPKAAA